MATGLPPAPRWAWVAMIAGVVAIAVMLPIALGRGQVEVSESASDRTPAADATQPTASPSATEETTAADEPPVIAVYGDGYSAGSDEGGNGAAGWPALVADRLDADVRLHAVQGAGYVAGGGGGTFLEQVHASPEPDADVVVVFGSRNDTGAPSQEITDQASATYEAIGRRAVRRCGGHRAGLVGRGRARRDVARSGRRPVRRRRGGPDLRRPARGRLVLRPARAHRERRDPPDRRGPCGISPASSSRSCVLRWPGSRTPSEPIGAPAEFVDRQ